MSIKLFPKYSLRLIVIFILIIFVVITFASYSYSWTGYTHKWICDDANLSNLDCALADNSKIQSQHPDIIFKNHHCASNKYDCSARTVADKYLTLSTPNAKDFAAHLYADSMVPVHWYGFDYDTCHKIFEDKVEEKLREAQDVKYSFLGSSIDFSEWNITMQCSTKINNNYTQVTLYVDNMYMDTVVNYVSEQMHSTPIKKELQTYDLTLALVITLFLILLLFILFIKNFVV